MRTLSFYSTAEIEQNPPVVVDVIIQRWMILEIILVALLGSQVGSVGSAVLLQSSSYYRPNSVSEDFKYEYREGQMRKQEHKLLLTGLINVFCTLKAFSELFRHSDCTLMQSWLT